MKKFIVNLAAAFFMVACGDETTIQGYTDVDVQNMFAIFKDSVVQGIEDSIMKASKDTVYKISKDTVYKISKDTIVKNIKDTLVFTTRDTIYSVIKKDSTVYVKKVDTIYTTVNDSVLFKVIDSLFHSVDFVKNEIPRDSLITLYDTIKTETGSVITSKTWHGKVYKGLFYDTVAYQGYVDGNHGFPQVYIKSPHEYFCWHQCGDKFSPDYLAEKGCWKTSAAMHQKFDGWRLFNLGDVISLGTYIENVIGQESIYITHTTDVWYQPNAYFYYYRIKSNGEIVITNEDVKYMCVYDLNSK